MAGRPISMFKGFSFPFTIPDIRGRFYSPGAQPYSPGESHIKSHLPHFTPVPWPNAVPSLVALANHPGIPRERALQISNNSTAQLPSNYLFMSGFAGKSKG